MELVTAESSGMIQLGIIEFRQAQLGALSEKM